MLASRSRGMAGAGLGESRCLRKFSGTTDFPLGSLGPCFQFLFCFPALLMMVFLRLFSFPFSFYFLIHDIFSFDFATLWWIQNPYAQLDLRSSLEVQVAQSAQKQVTLFPSWIAPPPLSPVPQPEAPAFHTVFLPSHLSSQLVFRS